MLTFVNNKNPYVYIAKNVIHAQFNIIKVLIYIFFNEFTSNKMS